jgi:outer membrane protein TolC
MAEIGYKEGVVILQDVLSAEVELSGAQANRIGAVYDYLKSLAALRKAMGVDDFNEAAV